MPVANFVTLALALQYSRNESTMNMLAPIWDNHHPHLVCCLQNPHDLSKSFLELVVEVMVGSVLGLYMYVLPNSDLVGGR